MHECVFLKYDTLLTFCIPTLYTYTYHYTRTENIISFRMKINTFFKSGIHIIKLNYAYYNRANLSNCACAYRNMDLRYKQIADDFKKVFS